MHDITGYNFNYNFAETVIATIENYIPSKATSVSDGEERMSVLLKSLSQYDKQYLYDMLYNEGIRRGHAPTEAWRREFRKEHS